MLDDLASNFVVPLTMIVLGFAAAVLWARWRWKKLKPELFPEGEEVDPSIAGHAAAQSDPEQLARILRRAHNWLSAQEAPETKVALAALAVVEESGQGAGALSTLIAKALASADIVSLLVKSGDTHCYFLVVPNRFENAATLRRHPAFSSGWCEHLAALRDRVGAGAPHSNLIAFAFFLDPDGGESLLQLSFVEKSQMRVPNSMLDARAARTEEVEPLDLSMEFKLAA